MESLQLPEDTLLTVHGTSAKNAKLDLKSMKLFHLKKQTPYSPSDVDIEQLAIFEHEFYKA